MAAPTAIRRVFRGATDRAAPVPRPRATDVACITVSDHSKPPFDPQGRDNRVSVREALSQNAARLSGGSRLQGPLGQPTRADEMETWQPSVLERIECLGFVGEASRAFDLLPLVLVAWADGTVQPEERATILQLLHMRGLHGTAAYTLFEALLELRPATIYMEAALQLLRELVAQRPDGGASVVDLCVEVAAAAGDAIGSPDPIAPEEREAIAEIAKTLGPSAYAELALRLGSPQ